MIILIKLSWGYNIFNLFRHKTTLCEGFCDEYEKSSTKQYSSKTEHERWDDNAYIIKPQK